MKTFFTFGRSTPVVILAVTLFGLIGAQAVDKKAAPKGKTSPAAQVPEAPPVEYKSVFEDSRVDPFFPKSLRFDSTPQTGTVTNAAPRLDVSQVIVKGIFLGKEKTAFINGKTLAEGESATIKLGKISTQIHVIEIRERSVIIKIDPEPEPKEIYLRATP